ncbi:hypothetical protein J2Z76_000283 [Sedimentibacter acidaminivorans]|uniref:DUF1905 domain-containing protein n=1 Tax=Sedimentibacter acidaminivorans TaxID=913099 RepID=A0ABS4G9R3_9FIRM|nr:DUF1905 domain-containing protein [Sedimentibacter acidaminivorans]MBP1924430.1 hypothetical protein [Sedimentibacter acidaminivorans]
MNYSFRSVYYKEGNRIFIKIPFNVWETCKKRGNIPVKVVIEDIPFECKLIPKGNGDYVIPVNKDVINKLDSRSEYSVHFTLLNQLTRINNSSPYNKDNPIRIIDSISYKKQPDIGFCGQTCLAMLAGISVDEVIKLMKSKKWQASISKVIESLDYFGFSHEEPVYTYGQMVEFPKCCIINVRGYEKSHLIVYFDGIFYDPTSDVTNDYKYENIISYITIN